MESNLAQFPPVALRKRLTGQLVCYGRSVVSREWPAMEDGSAGNTLSPWAVALFTTMKTAQPQTVAEQTAYGNWFDQTTAREKARRDRIHGAAGIIPASLWVVLGLLGGVVLVYVLFYADHAERARSQAMMIGSAATAVVATMLAVYSLDNPYRPGIGSLKPVAMERTLELVGAARHTLGDRAQLPCDEGGCRGEGPVRGRGRAPPLGRRGRHRVEQLPDDAMER